MKSKSFTISPPRESYNPRQSPRHPYAHHGYQNPAANLVTANLHSSPANGSNHHNTRMSQTPIIVADDPVLINTPTINHRSPHHTSSSSSPLPQPSVNHVQIGGKNLNAPSEAAAKIGRKIKCLKTILTIYLVLVFTFEIAWTYFIVKFQLIADLRSYHENWDEVWIKEFYKSTKNFFLFILILLILAIAIGIASVTTSNKHLAQTFIAVLLIEWVFEFIGVYESRDRNILIYRLVPCTLRPGLLTLMFMYIKNLNAEDEEYCKEVNKSEEEGVVNRHLAIQAAQQSRTRSGSNSETETNLSQQQNGNGNEIEVPPTAEDQRHVSVIPITTNF